MRRIVVVTLAAIVVVVGAALYKSYRTWSAEVMRAQSAVAELVEAAAKFRQANGRTPLMEELDLPATFEVAGRRVGRRLIASRLSKVRGFPPQVGTVIELLGLPCSIAQELDRANDDGEFRSGRVRASVESCVPGNSNDPLPVLAIALP